MPLDPIYGNMSDDDLLSLGRAAGYIPESPDSQESLSPPAEVPMQGGLTPPEPLSSPPTSSAPPFPANTSYSYGAGYRGYSEDQAKKVDKTRPGLNQDLAQADLDARKAADPMLDATNQAAESNRGAAVNVANAAAQKIKGEGENALVMQRLYDDFGAEEMKINAAATAQSNQAKADYLAALADFRASRVDPSQLWHNMTGGERFGTLMSAFVHDFLGAKGINTSTMATLNKAIDRNIDAQVNAIKTKGEVAEGFKSLWYMQRNQSASDAEARARVRGFLLDGAKQAIVANMSQYESALASAQGQAAVAKIDEELAKNLVKIYQHVDSNALALRGQAIDQWKARLSASIEQQNVNLRAQELELQRQLRGDKNKSSVEVIYDPETNEPKWYFIPGLKDDEKTAIRESMQGATELNDQFNELRELVRKAQPVFDGTADSRFAGTVQQEFDALGTRMGHSFAKAMGERATDQDVKDFMKGWRAKTWFNQAEAEKVIANTQAQLLRAPLAKMKSVAKDLPGSAEERIAAFGKTTSTGPFQGSLSEAKNTANPPDKTTDELHREQAIKGAAGVPGQETADEPNAEVRAAHERAAQQRPDLFGAGVDEPKSAIDTLKKVNTGEGYGQPEAPKDIKRFEASAVELAHLAQKAANEGTPDASNTALGQLKDLAGKYINQGMHDDPEAFFAAMLLQEMNAQ